MPTSLLPLLLLLAAAPCRPAATEPGTEPPADAPTAVPAPTSHRPMLLAAQYTWISQWQSELRSPYQSHLSLLPGGDHQSTNTLGAYTGWAPLDWAQLYFDTEKFMGAGVSGSTGAGGLTNGDVVREGATGLKKQFYVARAYARLMLPLGAETVTVQRAQDQVPGTEAARRLELKAGQMAVTDDFDRNRYAGAARTQFLNWSLWADTAFDYAANTRGYTDGVVLAYVSPAWSLRYGIYRMPVVANGQTLETLARAREQDLELTFSPPAAGTVVRLLAYLNTANMGIYTQATAIAAAAGTVPNIGADDAGGRHKYGFGINLEQPLADDGDTGLFLRLGWNDGQTESFAFTEVDRLVSLGGQLSGMHWRRPQDHLGAAISVQGLAGPHRDYLAAGGEGFVIGDGALSYAHERILETYYAAQWSFGPAQVPLHLQLAPDFQYMENPAYNNVRGPVRFYGVRVHLEY